MKEAPTTKVAYRDVQRGVRPPSAFKRRRRRRGTQLVSPPPRPPRARWEEEEEGGRGDHRVGHKRKSGKEGNATPLYRALFGGGSLFFPFEDSGQRDQDSQRGEFELFSCLFVQMFHFFKLRGNG